MASSNRGHDRLQRPRHFLLRSRPSLHPFSPRDRDLCRFEHALQRLIGYGLLCGSSGRALVGGRRLSPPRRCPGARTDRCHPIEDRRRATTATQQRWQKRRKAENYVTFAGYQGIMVGEENRDPTSRNDDISNEQGGTVSSRRYKYCATVAYDGTRYAGFQLQNASVHPRRLVTVQGKLERALTTFLSVSREALALQGAGRTDAGVHAQDQKVHFYSPRLLSLLSDDAVDGGDRSCEFKDNAEAAFHRMGEELSSETGVFRRSIERPSKALLAINSMLPEDLRVLDLRRVPLDFNVRYSLGKLYSYTYDVCDPVANPLTIRFRHRPRAPWRIDPPAMVHAAGAFVGTHDFSLLSSKPRDGSERSPIRTIRRCEVVPVEGGAKLYVEGDGFLYKQVMIYIHKISSRLLLY
jgi:tRNA pseudouridine38-40 synthase